MNKKILSTAAILAALSVLAGAFGAHFLKQKLSAPSLQTFETAVRYQFYHCLALLAVGILHKEFANKFLKWAGHFFIAGIILFSGSLYFLCAFSSYKFIGFFTPVGGLCFIAGWIFLAIGVHKNINA